MNPFISVVTATFNSAEFLQCCIDSVSRQACNNVEHIIIDGASTDGTVDIIKANQDKLSYWISEPDKGIYSAWNKAVPHIRGEWVLFLGADDRLANENVLADMVPHLKNSFPKHGLVYGILLIVERGKGEVLFSVGEPWSMVSGKYHQARIELPPHPATFQHISLFNGLHSFDENYIIAGDSKFMAYEVIQRDPLFVPIEITRFSVGGLSGCIGQRELLMWREEWRLSRELKIKVPGNILVGSFLKSLVKETSYRLFNERGVYCAMDIYRILTLRRPIHVKTQREKNKKSNN